MIQDDPLGSRILAPNPDFRFSVTKSRPTFSNFFLMGVKSMIIMFLFFVRTLNIAEILDFFDFFDFLAQYQTINERYPGGFRGRY